METDPIYILPRGGRKKVKGRRVEKGRLTTRMIGSEDTFPRLP